MMASLKDKMCKKHNSSGGQSWWPMYSELPTSRLPTMYAILRWASVRVILSHPQFWCILSTTSCSFRMVCTRYMMLLQEGKTADLAFEFIKIHSRSPVYLTNVNKQGCHTVWAMHRSEDQFSIIVRFQIDANLNFSACLKLNCWFAPPCLGKLMILAPWQMLPDYTRCWCWCIWCSWL